MNAPVLAAFDGLNPPVAQSNLKRRFADYFGLLRGIPDNATLPQPVLSRVADAVGSWSAETSSFFGFECVMGSSPVESTDFLFCSFRDEQLAATPEARLPSWAAAFGDANSEAWQRVAAFGREWLAEPSPLSEVENIWLEFDAPSPDGAADPCLFFGPSKKAPAGTMSALIQHALPLLIPHVAEARTRTLHHVIEALPPGTSVFHCGVMLARGRDGVRLMVMNLPKGEVPEALKACGWRGDAGKLRALLEQFDGLYDVLAVGIDVFEEGVGESLGLEFHLKAQARFEPRWGALMDALVNHAGADPRLASALPEFNGYFHPNKCPVRWPQSLRIEDRRFRSVLFYFVHHVKVTFNGLTPPSSKAYLGISHRFLAPDPSGKSSPSKLPASP